MTNLAISLISLGVMMVVAILVIWGYNMTCKHCNIEDEELVLSAIEEFKRLIESQRDDLGSISVMDVDRLVIEMKTRCPTVEFVEHSLYPYEYRITVTKGKVEQFFKGPYISN